MSSHLQTPANINSSATVAAAMSTYINPYTTRPNTQNNTEAPENTTDSRTKAPILTEEGEAELLRALSAGDRSLITIAADYDITLAELTLILTADDFAQKLERLAVANSIFIRHAAGMHLHTAVTLMARLLAEYTDQVRRIPVNYQDRRSIESHRRTGESARKCTMTLMRLARFSATPVTAHPDHPRPTRAAAQLTPAPVSNPKSEISTPAPPAPSRTPAPVLNPTS